MSYKKYKNALNSILRKEERHYYSQQLELNKKDLAKSWKIKKNVIGKKDQSNNSVPTMFHINNKKIVD